MTVLNALWQTLAQTCKFSFPLNEKYYYSEIFVSSFSGTDADGVYEFLLKNFEQRYNGNRAPFGFYVHASWFFRNEAYFQGYLKFIEHVQSLENAFIVSFSQLKINQTILLINFLLLLQVNIDKALQWVKNPSTLENIKNTWPECQKTYEPTCSPANCELNKGEELRYMTVCSDCPDEYPWLGNPLGDSQ